MPARPSPAPSSASTPRKRNLVDRRDPAVWAWLVVALLALLAMLPFQQANADTEEHAGATTPSDYAAARAAAVKPASAQAPGV
jgi:hypothetical protein